MATEVPYTPSFRESRAACHFGRLSVPSTATPSEPCPVLVNVHGGFWKPQWNLQTLPTATLLAGFGEDVATWDVEYARVDQGDPAASPEGGGWPHTCLDVLAALNALSDGTLPAELQARIDPKRVYLCGHSAGGQLVMWLGYVSRMEPAARTQLATVVEAASGPAAGAAMSAGVTADVCVLGVVALSPVASLSEGAADGLSDFHDAPINFLWRAGATAATASSELGAACPTALRNLVPITGGAQPPLRTLLVHGIDDIDVPASVSLQFASRAWAAESIHPVWLQLLPAADHYLVAGLCDLSDPTTKQTWAKAAAALRAFVLGDEEGLAAVCCDEEVASALCATAPPHTCASRSIQAIVGGGAEGEAFERKCAEEPEHAAAMARGLSRWYNWTGEPVPPQLDAWFARTAK